MLRRARVTEPPAHISAAEFARNAADLLARVHAKHARFIIEAEGQPIAVLEPAPGQRVATIGGFLAMLDGLDPVDDDFARDVADVPAQTQLAPPSWDS